MEQLIENPSKISNDHLPTHDTEFGHAIKKYYQLEENYTNVNHGSYGASPKFVVNARQEYIRQFESQPDFFFSHIHPKLYEKSRLLLSQYVDAEPEDLIFLKNATEAASYVLKSLTYQPGDIILMFDFVYGAVKSLCDSLVDSDGVQLVIMETNQEILNSKEKIIHLVKSYVETYQQKIRIAIIDHISSVPAILVPIEQIIPLLRKNNILCMIDAAHAFNHVNISLQKLDPDFYYSNIHKWAPMPKSLAFLYVKKEIRERQELSNLSRKFTKNSEELGTRDFSNIYCFPETINFIEKLGQQRMMRYCQTLAKQAGQKISELWKTDLLTFQENNELFMINVLLPCQEKEKIMQIFSDSKSILEKFKIFVAVTKYKETFYARFSCYIYNQLSDYEYAADTILKLLDCNFSEESKL